MKNKKIITNDDLTIRRYSTGIIKLDTLLNGGLPIKNIVNINGPSGGGKTTIMLQIARNVITKYNKRVIYFDIDGGATYELIESLGAASLLYDDINNPDGKLFLLNVSTMEDIITIMDTFALDENTALIIIDTETSVTNKAVIEDDSLGTENNGTILKTTMWRRKAKTFKAIMRKSNATLILVSQCRYDNSKIKLKSAASLGIEYMRCGEISIKLISKSIENKMKISLRTSKGKILKSKHKITTDLVYGKGI